MMRGSVAATVRAWCARSRWTSALLGLPVIIMLQGCSANSHAVRPEANWVPSPYFRGGPRTPDDVHAIVLHTTEGRYDETQSFAANQARIYHATIRYFQDNEREVSAHYVIGPHGELTAMVDERNIAHTQTYYNARSFGIECAGWSDRPETWTPAMIDTLVDLIAYLSVTWDVPIERPDGNAYEGPHAISTEHGPRFDGSGVVGHDQVQPWNKTDPGPHFPWDEVLTRARERAGRSS